MLQGASSRSRDSWPGHRSHAERIVPSVSDGSDVLVVGAAVLRHGRVLATRRTRPAEAAGRGGVPGGKGEPGEEPAGARVREIREELGVEVSVTGRLAGEQ